MDFFKSWEITNREIAGHILFSIVTTAVIYIGGKLYKRVWENRVAPVPAPKPATCDATTWTSDDHSPSASPAPSVLSRRASLDEERGGEGRPPLRRSLRLRRHSCLV